MTYRRLRIVHSEPRLGVTIFDYKDHPWYKPTQRFQAVQTQGYGSVGLYGKTPEDALNRLDAHLEKVNAKNNR